MKPAPKTFDQMLTGVTAGLAACAACWIAQPHDAWAESIELLSPVYTVDRIYKSMLGPDSLHENIYLGSKQEPELIWITGYKAVVVGDDGSSQMSQEFMCHNTLSLNRDLSEHARLFGTEHHTDRRLFTLSQGQTNIEFPKGFAIPILSSEPLMLQTQVLNLNEGAAPRKLRHRVNVEFVKDRDLDEPLKPLMMSYAYGVALVDVHDASAAEGFAHGAGCHIGSAAGDVVHTDGSGRRFTQHWVVPPGRQETHTIVTSSMQLPFDTTAHYVSVHLHPFGESLELRDVTANETVYKSRARNSDDRIHLERVEHFSSQQGIPLYRDHEYELISVYNNTSGTDQDAMALMFLYVLDKGFQRPDVLDRNSDGDGAGGG